MRSRDLSIGSRNSGFHSDGLGLAVEKSMQLKRKEPRTRKRHARNSRTLLATKTEEENRKRTFSCTAVIFENDDYTPRVQRRERIAEQVKPRLIYQRVFPLRSNREVLLDER